MKRFVCTTKYSESYAGDSVATGRTSQG